MSFRASQGDTQSLFERVFLVLLVLCCLCLLSACNLGKPKQTPSPSPAPSAPRVEILSPPHNQKVVEGVIFDIQILAADTVGIARVELYVDEQLAQSSHSESGRETQYRVAMNWYARGIGWHKFSAIAYREDGTASPPHTIALEVIAQS